MAPSSTIIGEQAIVPFAGAMSEQFATTSRHRARKLVAKSSLMVADLAMVALALLLAYVTRAADSMAPNLQATLAEHVALGVGSLPLWLAIFARRGLYRSRFVVRRSEELRRIVNAVATTTLTTAAAAYVTQLPVSRAWLFLSAVFAVALVGLQREIARAIFRRLRHSGRVLRRVVMVGSNDEARELATMLDGDPTLGYQVVGFVDDGCEGDLELLGTIFETVDIARRTGAEGVIVAASSSSAAVTNRVVRELLNAGIHVELTSTLRDVDAERLTVRPLGRFPVAYLEPRTTHGWRSHAKRTFDLVLASASLLAVAPVTLLAAIAIKLDSPGPVFFRQERLGRDGRIFRVWKFRTMVLDAEALLVDLRDRNEADGPLFKLRDDPRVTRVGKLLRKASLDEVPQLLNVFAGDMSLVGPRPALPSELALWEDDLRGRLRVKPGITGMWQVHGRSDASFEAYSRLDLYYVDNWSLLTDLMIVAKTVPAVLFGRGAY